MRVTVLCVGKVKEPWLIKGLAEYQKRLSRFCRLTIIEVPDLPLGSTAGAGEERLVREREGKALLARIPVRAYTIVLDREGQTLDSPGLARSFERVLVQGTSEIFFIIGGSLGLSKEVLTRGDMVLSFSALTFPHQLMRLILVEQVYRAFKIRAGETYHK